MSPKARVLLLVIIMFGVAVGVTGITLSALYSAAFDQQKARLLETAHSQARLMEEIARHEARYAQWTEDADLDDPQPVPFTAELAEPMRLALSEKSGRVVGLDYRGEQVLAAHEPVNAFDLGVVAKIDLSEVRAPFVRAGLLAAGGAAGLILLGMVAFLRISNPIVRRLEESERKYRGLFDSAADMLLLADRDEILLDANPAACSACGYSRKELIGQSITRIIHTDGHHLADGTTRELAGETAFLADAVCVRKDGTEFPVEVRLSPVMYEGQQAALGAVRDVTERRESEQALKESEERFAKAFQASPIPIVITTLEEGRFVDVNASFLQMVGYDRDELIGRTTLELGLWHHPEERRHFVEMAVEKSEAGGHFEVLVATKSGQKRSCEAAVSAMNLGGEACLLSIVNDVTERKRVEQALRENEQQIRDQLVELNHVYNTAPVGLCLLDRDLRYLRINEPLAAMNGHSVEEHIGRTVAEVLPELAENVTPAMRRVIETGEPVLDTKVQGTTLAEPDALRHWLVSYYPVKADHGQVRAVGSVVQDITERKRAECRPSWLTWPVFPRWAKWWPVLPTRSTSRCVRSGTSPKQPVTCLAPKSR